MCVGQVFNLPQWGRFSTCRVIEGRLKTCPTTFAADLRTVILDLLLSTPVATPRYNAREIGGSLCAAGFATLESNHAVRCCWHKE
jgi:hypothetical protein